MEYIYRKKGVYMYAYIVYVRSINSCCDGSVSNIFLNYIYTHNKTGFDTNYFELKRVCINGCLDIFLTSLIRGS